MYTSGLLCFERWVRGHIDQILCHCRGVFFMNNDGTTFVLFCLFCSSAFMLSFWWTVCNNLDAGADADEKEVMDQQVAVRKSTVRSHCSWCGAARHVAVNSKGQCFK